jgi:hypothetical protein
MPPRRPESVAAKTTNKPPCSNNDNIQLGMRALPLLTGGALAISKLAFSMFNGGRESDMTASTAQAAN